MKHRNDNRIEWRDIPAALGLLSRLPVPVDAARATERGAAAAWAYPVAGLALALLAGGLGGAAASFGVPPALVAGLVLTTLVILTGALHEDGLADCADGFWGGWDKARRLEIMKDSHIGAYGVIALVLVLGLRWQAMAELFATGLFWAALIPAAMLSRAAMVGVMASLPPARTDGLSRAVGRPAAFMAYLGAGLAVISALILAGWAGVGMALIAGLSAVLCAGIARAKIGGQTGDVLGFTQQVTETAVLLALLALA